MFLTSRSSDRKEQIYKPMETYSVYSNEVVAGSVNPNFINPRQGLDRLQKLMDEYCGGFGVNYMTNEKLLHIGLKKIKISGGRYGEDRCIGYPRAAACMGTEASLPHF